jgi:hypothetical protein
MLLSEAKPSPLFNRPNRASLRRNVRNKQRSGLVFFSNSLRVSWQVSWQARSVPSGKNGAADMIRLRLIAALVFSALAVLAASPAVAQGATSNAQSQSAVQSPTQDVLPVPTPAPTQAPTTGVFCIEEMTATFCNVVTGPNTNGYGTRSASGSSSGAGSSGAGGGTSSIPPCPAEPPFNELCN